MHKLNVFPDFLPDKIVVTSLTSTFISKYQRPTIQRHISGSIVPTEKFKSSLESSGHLEMMLRKHPRTHDNSKNMKNG